MTTKESVFELRDINLAFPKGKLTVITGPTASGKMALLTVLDNIIFEYMFDQARYDTVIEACAILSDFKALEDGDLTEIGSKGIVLSGGQKTRVALARTVYAPTQYLILDNISSAVDSHTTHYLFNRLICGPLGANCTILLVTHHIELVLPSIIAKLKARGVLNFIEHEVHEDTVEEILADADSEKGDTAGILLLAGAMKGGLVLFKMLLNSLARLTFHFFDITPIGRILNWFGKGFDISDDMLAFMLYQCTMSIASSSAISLLRFVEPTRGRIIFDGINIMKIGTYRLRSRITFIPQDATLFAGTIRDNFDPFNEHTDAECLDALALIHLIIPDLSRDPSRAPSTEQSHHHEDTTTAGPSLTFDIDESEIQIQGAIDAKILITLDSAVSVGGQNLNGQRQLLAITRTLLRQSAVVILDETTSSIDKAGDMKIQVAIHEEIEHSLLLTIARRLGTIIEARIIRIFFILLS
ncbi:hypothetical protein M422DRAFT_258311 [Sphaerobolus stellatus SS14]|uniref:ABC transporter domain-containing protein n=1 Tax=Sphaerobolus stellatus (strain SS14) TaxID=990650 RepID=A0A0C9U7J0_SPHS4|nr:hypothetical protein M422DRAFT_258311 [Sphaerobolus stellatus SS14]